MGAREEGPLEELLQPGSGENVVGFQNHFGSSQADCSLLMLGWLPQLVWPWDIIKEGPQPRHKWVNELLGHGWPAELVCF